MGCCDQPGLMSLSAGIQNLLESVIATTDTETIALSDAAHRVLAINIVAQAPVPGFDNSAMDGYALRSTDQEKDKNFSMQGKALAGAPFTEKLKPNHVIRIMTGAAIPDGADTVIMQENAVQVDENVSFTEIVAQGNNVRRNGDDIQKGQIVIGANTLINAVHLALLASVGCSSVTVFRKTRVGLVSTGDELRTPGEPLGYGDIYNSNGPAITRMLENMNVDIIDYGILPDDPSLFREVFTRADTECDFVITSGGVSVGEADYTKEILEELGDINFWKLAIKPGKPFAFGKLPNSYFIGLPGNPVSAMVTFHILASQAIRQHQHIGYRAMQALPAVLTTSVKKSPGRMDFQRGYWQSTTGEIRVETTRSTQGSHIISSLAKANCYIVLEQERGSAEVGETVDIWLFDEILN